MKYTSIIVILSIASSLTGCGPNTPPTPEEAAFNEANAKIRVYKDQSAFGNTPEAEAMAKEFSSTMEEMQKKLFSGGGKIHGITRGHFLTYCQTTSDEIVFLCVVPDMKEYKGEVRDALSELAWNIAQDVAGTTAHDKKLIVALRGALVYGPVWSGKMSGSPEAKGNGRDSLKPFYPAFVK